MQFNELRVGQLFRLADRERWRLVLGPSADLVFVKQAGDNCRLRDSAIGGPVKDTGMSVEPVLAVCERCAGRGYVLRHDPAARPYVAVCTCRRFATDEAVAVLAHADGIFCRAVSPCTLLRPAAGERVYRELFIPPADRKAGRVRCFDLDGLQGPDLPTAKPIKILERPQSANQGRVRFRRFDFDVTEDGF